MKRALAVSCLVLLAGFVIFTLISCIWSPIDWGRKDVGRLSPPCDFVFRMNEVECLRRGVNPFDVWHGDVVMEPYFPNNRFDLRSEKFTEPINAYAPWEYTLMLPLSYLPRRVAWCVYLALMFVCLGVIAAAGYRMGKALHGDVWDGILVATIPLVLSYYPIWSNFNIGNFMVPVMAAVVGMAWCLNRKYDILAGLCWAFAMVKPQVALLLAVPLLWRRKLKVCVVAAGTCLVLSVPPAIMCGTSIVKLIFQTPAANTILFKGCGTWPFCISPGSPIDICLGLFIGTVFCLGMTWIMHKKADWLIFLMPATICSMCWTYFQVYTHALSFFFFVTLLVQMLNGMSAVGVWVTGGFAMLSMSRLYTCCHRLSEFWPQAFSWFVNKEETHFLLDELNSTASLIVAMVFCCLTRRCRNDALDSRTLL